MQTYGLSVRTQGAVGDGHADDASALQRALDAGVPRVVVPAGTYRLGRGLRIHSGTHLWVHPRAQLIYADGAGQGPEDAMLTNADHESGNADIVVEGGIWDGNNTGNPRGPDAPDSYPGVSFNFTNVAGLTLRAMVLRDAESYFILLGKVRKFLIEDIGFEIRHLRPNQDGIHISGHCEDGEVRNVIGHGSHTPNDDMVAILADDALHRAQNLKAFNGPIRRIRVSHLRADSCHSFLRLLSVDHPIEDVDASDIKGGCCCCAINMDACRECRVKLFDDCDRPGGVGDIRRVRVRDMQVFKATDTNHQPLIDFRTRADDVVVERFARDSARDVSPATPTLVVEKAGAVEVALEGVSEAVASQLPEHAVEVRPDPCHRFRAEKHLEEEARLVISDGGFDRLSIRAIKDG